MTTTRILSRQCPDTPTATYVDGTQVDLRGSVEVPTEQPAQAGRPCGCGHGDTVEILFAGQYELVCTTDLV